MFEWILAERKGESLTEHLAEARKQLDIFDFGDVPKEKLYGYMIPAKNLIMDMLKAAARIIKAVKNNEKIVIFGHDDADGITSTYLIFDFLTKIGSHSHYYFIPNRLIDHHGIKESFIKTVNSKGYSLVVTVDGGVSSAEGIEQLNQLGCDVIVTDHHIVPETLPTAYAIVNPKRDDCPYPDKMLAGVGITYFLLVTIAELLSIPLEDKYLFWTAVGTIADKAPMVGVNRIICKTVFENWQSMIERPISLWSSSIVDGNNDYFEKNNYIYNITKLLSSGREAEGENSALYFLLAPDYKKREIVSSLIRRKAKYESDMSRVRNILTRKAPEDNDLYYFYFDENDEIPFSLLGWAGNCLCILYKIPVMILKKKGDSIVGEGKCPEKFDLVKAFDYCTDALTQYGGHSRAAGVVTNEEKLGLFEKLFAEYVDSVKDEINSGKIIQIDAEVQEQEIPSLKKMISSFSPFGESAPIPVFLVKNVDLQRVFKDAVFRQEKNITAGRKYDVVFTYRCEGRMQVLDYKETEKNVNG